MQTKISKKGKNENITSLFVLSFFLSLSLISFSLCSCGSGGGGGGGYIPSSGGTVNPTVFSGWEMTNGPFSGAVHCYAIDPVNPDIIFIGTRGGLFKSIDGGQNWALVTDQELSDYPIEAVAIAPNNNQVVFVGTWSNGIYKSVDGGFHWTPTDKDSLPKHPWPHEEYVLPADQLVIDPHNSQIAYAILGDNHYLYKTTNGGDHWDKVEIKDQDDPDDPGLDDPLNQLFSLVIDPTDENSLILYAATYRTGVYESIDGAESWSKKNEGLPAHTDDSIGVDVLGIDPTDPKTIFAGLYDYGLYKITDTEDTWEYVGVTSGLYYWDVYDIAVEPGDNPAVYVSILSRDIPPGDPSDSGVYRSLDKGNTWEPIDYFAENPPRRITISRSDPQVIYVYSGGGLLVNRDGAQTEKWDEIKTQGLVDTQVYSMVMNAIVNRIVFVGTPTGIFKTEDGGQSWERKGLGGKSVYAIAMNSDTIYAAAYRGLFKSSDGGETWHSINNTTFNCLAIDPNNPDIVYAGNADGKGVFKTEDGGNTWEDQNFNLAGKDKWIKCVVIKGDEVFIGTGYILPEVSGTVFRKTHEESEWEEKGDDLPNKPIWSLVTDPKNPQIMYAGTEVGLYVSSDEGNSWSPVDKGPPNTYITSLALNPYPNMDVIIAGVWGRGVYGSMDEDGWTPMNDGLTNLCVNSLAMDLRDLDHPVIYAGTDCGVFKAYK
jgi:photosystem II stability/assembly factor-like uncharacterized protein